MIDLLSRFDSIRAVDWQGDHLRLLDQRVLPFEERFVECRSPAAVASAITDLVVRGAPAIGIAAGWATLLLVREQRSCELATLEPGLAHLVAARPTAVNLAWAVDRMRRLLATPGCTEQAVFEEAQRIEQEDLQANQRMAMLGSELIAPGSGVLTHCNTGALATAGLGTALGVIRAAWAQQKLKGVFAGETRPWNQGARLTVWELFKDGIPATLIADSAASHLMSEERVQWVIVGADRICANGDTANKVGTRQLAIAARYHGVRFMVVAPSSTIDMAMPDGSGIEIELRDPGELTHSRGVRTVAEGVDAWNPVFDVTPAGLIDALVTELGVVIRPNTRRMRDLFAAS
jgi:methylthioribose-1-phosphate isomerase